jgi:diguanylate cyclase (GGDEF)-like protein
MLGVVANQVAISLQNGRMVQSLEEQATTDGLTGLVNHRTFQERFSAMLGRADRHKFRVAMLLTDIDHFKKVNDTYGHPTGDAVLKRVAAILKASARKIDIVARYGGEEFALVLEGTDRAGARQLAERIREEVSAQTFESSKGPFKATLSLGVAVYPDDGKAKQDVISCADKALYAAKHAGRNRTVCHGEVVREDTGIPQHRFHLLGREARDYLGSETGEGAPVGLALAQDRHPRKSCLRALQNQELEQPAVVVHGHAPFFVVIGDQQRIYACPAAAPWCFGLCHK